MLENIINDLTNKVDKAWNRNMKLTNITRYSKSWWDNKCSRELKNIESQRVSKTGNPSTKRVPKEHFSTSKSMKLPTKNESHGSS